jgi:hypothetical protein
MRKVFLVLMVFDLWCVERVQAAEWVNVSGNLSQPDIRVVAMDPRNSKVIFAASGKRVYKTEDGGISWKRVLSVRGTANQVQFILVSPLDSKVIYVATARGVHRSLDGGGKWKYFFGGIGDRAKNVFCVAVDRKDAGKVWVGTAEGLFWVDAKRGDFQKAMLENEEIHSILFSEKNEGFALVSARDKIYKSVDGKRWSFVFSNQKDFSEEEPDLALDDWEMEEPAPSPFISNLVFVESHQRFYAAAKNGILRSDASAESWVVLQGQNLPSQEIKSLTVLNNGFYAAVDRGVFEWDPELGRFHEIYKGLDSGQIHTLSGSLGWGFLLTGTSRGVFQSFLASTETQPEQVSGGSAQKISEILDSFKEEPSILEIQNAAIEYAEVHPRKIDHWRKAAARKAWLPSLSLDADFDRTKNIDLDRGGTGDPDTFIIGPEEKSFDWSVGLSWDLADLVWSGDQTSIDTRSRLMVELRDDVLTQVNHLYFERRRLQVEMAMAPQKDPWMRAEKEIRLQELTAGIDALTGGYLSRRLSRQHQ